MFDNVTLFPRQALLEGVLTENLTPLWALVWHHTLTKTMPWFKGQGPQCCNCGHNEKETEAVTDVSIFLRVVLQ